MTTRETVRREGLRFKKLNSRLQQTMRKPLLILVGIAVLVVGLVAAERARPKLVPLAPPIAPLLQAGGPISWSQQPLTVTVFPGDYPKRNIIFTSAGTLQSVVIEAVPEIKRFMNMQPVTFQTVAAGQPQKVNITFSIPAGTMAGPYEGTIHIRDGNRTLPQTLKVTVTVGLPPDPGPAGMTTLAGVDSDGDGVRDDTQRWIALTYPNSAKIRAALTQGTIATQGFLIDAQNQALSIQHSMAMKAATDCLSYIRPNDYGAILTQLESQIVNTALRGSAYIQANGQVGGQFYALPNNDQERIAQCSFDPNSLPN